MSDKSKKMLRALVLLVMLTALIPINHTALAATPLPPVDMFQLPWDQGIAWVAIDGIDNGSKRPETSSHNYLKGGAIDFAPRSNMVTGENTSNFWVTAAAAGIVIERSACHVRIAHEGGWITEYQFLGLVQVQTGDTVARNQRLGIIADGVKYKYCPGYQEINVPHLHFMLRPTLVGATLAGWQVKYSSFWNTTTFSKDGTTVGLYKPLMNLPATPVTPTATLPATATPDPSQATATPGGPTNTPDPSQASATPGGSVTNTPDGQVTPTTDPSQATATPTPGDQATSTPDPSQATATPDGQATFTPTPSGPYVTTTASPAGIGVAESSFVAVHLHNVPAAGFNSAEFTCTYNPALVEVSNISITNLFGNDSVNIINGPQNGTFIVAIAGSSGNKATTDGNVFNFNAKGLGAGETPVNCTARVSQGTNVLTPLPSFGAVLTVHSAPSTPTFTPTATETPSTGWLTFTNLTYGFQFHYPLDGQLTSGSDDTFARINLPFTPGTNLGEKYLEVIPALNPVVCQSPLATQSMLQTSESVVINGLPFLKQTGGDGAAGSLYQWEAYSTQRDNVCVSLDFILHSHNPGVFSTPPPLFDYAAESQVFGQIVETYAWLAQNPTATPTVPSGPVETSTPAPTSTLAPSPTATPPPFGMLTGQVLASKPVTINLYNPDDTIAVSMPANTDGTFAFTVTAGDEYKVVALAGGHLSAQAFVTTASGNTTTLPTFTLPAGDIDSNTVIDQFDALTIGMSYNTTAPSEADLNNDGIINVLDLEILAQSYRKTGPVAWE